VLRSGHGWEHDKREAMPEGLSSHACEPLKLRIGVWLHACLAEATLPSLVWGQHLSPFVQLLVPLTVIQPCECFATFRALMRPFSSMTGFVILPVKVATESFAADCTSVAGLLGFYCSGCKDCRKVYHFWVKSFHMSTKLDSSCEVVSGKGTYLSRSAWLTNPSAPKQSGTSQ
jgi:hypothetical protein